MGKVRPGNKLNSALNGEWATHVKKDMKKSTSRIRRTVIKKDNDVRLEEKLDADNEYSYDVNDLDYFDFEFEKKEIKEIKPRLTFNLKKDNVKTKTIWLTAMEMIERLQLSKNLVIADMCKRIINKESTISQEWDKNHGNFAKAVLIGEFNIAMALADLDNKQILEEEL